MANWLIVNVKDTKNGKVTSAEEKWLRRSVDGFWGLPQKAHNKLRMKPGDRALFYLGLPLEEFAGPVTLTSGHAPLSPDEKQKLSHDDLNLHPDFGIYFALEQSQDKRCSVKSIFESLSIHEKDFNKWRNILRRGVIELPQEDFDFIVSKLK